MKELYRKVEGMAEKDKSLHEIKKSLINKGFSESDIIEAIIKYNLKGGYSGKRHLKKIFTKEILDKIGYGFASLQFINILFFLTGASYFLIGIVNGLKAVFSAVTNSFLQSYSAKRISRIIVGLIGILFGLTFFYLAFARYYSSRFLFATAFLAGGVCVIFYGDFYQRTFLAIKRSSAIMNKLAKYGLIITALSLFFGAYIIDSFKNGYFIIFAFAAVLFILSGMLVLFMRGEKTVEPENASAVYKPVFSLKRLREPLKLLKNKPIFTLLIAGSATSLVQTIGNSYYGIFIYNTFRDVGFGGFLNVAMVFLIAVFSSLIGAIVTRINVREYGKFPILIFGTLLLALMPLSYYYKPTLVTITMGTMFGVIGGAIIGFAQGLSTSELNKDQRKSYFSISNVFVFFVYLLFAPLLALFAQNYGLERLFILLVVILVLLIPFYLIIVLQERKI